MVPHPVEGSHSSVGDEIGDVQHTSMGGRPSHDAVREADLGHGMIGGERVIRERPGRQGPLRLIGDPHYDRGHGHEGRGGAGDGRQHLIGVERRRDGLAETHEGLQVGGAVLCLAQQAVLVDGQRGLIG